MNKTKITYLDFIHGAVATVPKKEREDFIHLYGLSQYSSGKDYKKGDRIFSEYIEDGLLTVHINNKTLLPTVNF